MLELKDITYQVEENNEIKTIIDHLQGDKGAGFVASGNGKQYFR